MKKSLICCGLLAALTLGGCVVHDHDRGRHHDHHGQYNNGDRHDGPRPGGYNQGDNSHRHDDRGNYNRR
ncbi:hypothetical protein TUM12370_27630 [Salmonella enterica subsp. enterica serovar Choleraesuis]|nr:hypothetical protein TUM12370_27630 [Salmonella enterica subsp. enterica serovar Choleraesuis]